jgi:two-component system sensor histidine kinase CpxA
MKSLFLRIFLSFWLAMGLIVASGSVVAAIFVWHRLDALQKIEPLDFADSAEVQLRAQGVVGLQTWIREKERTYVGLSFFFIDGNGQDIFGRRLPDYLQKRVRRLQQHGMLKGEHPDGVHGDPLRLFAQIRGSDGAVYTLMAGFAGSPPFILLKTADVSILLVLIAVGVSGVICVWLARYVTRPVTQLQKGARELAAGNLDARVGAEFQHRRDELGVLARDFDRMAERLRLLVDSKETLLRDVSHELRTPLARLRVALGLARRPASDITRELDRIEREAERLDELIGDILHLSRLTSAQPTVHCERFDLSELVLDVVSDTRIEAEAQDKSVQSEKHRALEIDADSELLRRAIENVVRNALRFTAVGTAVEVNVSRVGEQGVITVRDHGPGVQEQHLQRIFEPFYRVAEARDRASGGFGLGLAITARVIAVHNGTVVARNAPDGGLIVTLELPVRSTVPSATPLQAGAPPLDRGNVAVSS